jgi:glycerol-3-phosphate acyltransferase PlsX
LAVEGKNEPTVSLLNIGEEAIKGGDTIKQAGELLRAAAAAGLVNFHGNVEGNDIFKGSWTSPSATASSAMSR